MTIRDDICDSICDADPVAEAHRAMHDACEELCPEDDGTLYATFWRYVNAAEREAKQLAIGMMVRGFGFGLIVGAGGMLIAWGIIGR